VSPTPKYVSPTPGAYFPTPSAPKPTPKYVSPTPGAYFPTPSAPKPTPKYVSPTPGAYFPTPAGPRPTPKYVSPTPGAYFPTPTAVRPTPTYVSPTPPTTVCAAHGQAGVCMSTTRCTLTSYPASSGVTDDGCRHITDASVQCCAPAPPRGAVVDIGQPARIPSGRNCALARPSGCSAFNGRTLTVNVKFSDEVVRIHSHAQNARIRVYITDSFRRIGSGNYGASRSRHKVGFALDMNANGCNSACMCNLRSISNAGAKRFLQAVVADSTLHWGADPSNPINWSIYSGGRLQCSKDSVHIQSRTYEDGGSTYDSMRTCLSNEYSAGRFQSFSCASGVALLNDDVRAEVEAEMNGEDVSDNAIATGTIVIIVIASICCCALLVLLVAGLVMFVFASRTEEPTFDERGAIGFQNEVYMTNASENDQYSSAVYDQAPAAKNTYAQGNYATGSAAGQPDFYSAQAFGGNDVAAYSAQPLNYQGGAGGDFKCELCGKAYSFAEDLQHHIEKRHP